VRAPTDDQLAVLLLPGRLEGLALEAHARDLLSIPRVVALEPSRVRPPRFLRDVVSFRQARRLRFPGRPRVLVLYHPAQYPLARALCACHENLELWYIPPGRGALEPADPAHARELLVFDELARQRARQVLTATEGGVDATPLRARLRELDVINPRAFIPSARPRPR
jgi:hypothetical protein